MNIIRNSLTSSSVLVILGLLGQIFGQLSIDQFRTKAQSRFYRVTKSDTAIRKNPKKRSKVTFRAPKGMLLIQNPKTSLTPLDSNKWIDTYNGFVASSDVELVTTEIETYSMDQTAFSCGFRPSKIIVCKELYPHGDAKPIQKVFDISDLNWLIDSGSTCPDYQMQYDVYRDWSKVQEERPGRAVTEYTFHISKETQKVLQFEQSLTPWECGD